jgi:formate hydrogenlyase subunit 3/multisubunit Na+/H+ antiporter MnhD subunit
LIASTLELARAHAPVLLIALPLSGAALAFVFASKRTVWLLACLLMAGAAWLAAGVLTRQLVTHAPFATLPGLAPDGIGMVGAALMTGLALLCVIASGASLQNADKRVGALVLALLLCIGAGWVGALLARDFIGAFLAAETAWLAALALVAVAGERDRAALNGGFRMLTVGAVSAALFLLGAGLIARSVGSLDFAVLPLAHVDDADAAVAGAALVLMSLAIKAGTAPLHFWLGAAIGRSGTLAAMAVVALTVAGALLLIVRVSAFAAPAPAIGVGVSAALALLGAASIVIGSLQAIGAGNVLRLVAYAGAAQAGAVLISAALGSPAGFAAALIQIAAMAAASLALLGGFAASGVGLDHAALDGLGRRAPFSGIAITLGALSLMGAPLTLGFLGRWRVIEAAVGVEWWWAALLVIGASLAGVVYAGRLVERLYFRRAETLTPIQRDPWRLALAPMLIVSVVVIALGVAPEALLRAASAAAEQAAGAP